MLKFNTNHSTGVPCIERCVTRRCCCIMGHQTPLRLPSSCQLHSLHVVIRVVIQFTTIIIRNVLILWYYDTDNQVIQKVCRIIQTDCRCWPVIRVCCVLKTCVVPTAATTPCVPSRIRFSFFIPNYINFIYQIISHSTRRRITVGLRDQTRIKALRPSTKHSLKHGVLTTFALVSVGNLVPTGIRINVLRLWPYICAKLFWKHIRMSICVLL